MIRTTLARDRRRDSRASACGGSHSHTTLSLPPACAQHLQSRQLSGVKEAAERGTLKLRNFKEAYAGYLRQRRLAENSDSPMPPPFSFQSQDLLQPFLLACNYSDAGKSYT